MSIWKRLLLASAVTAAVTVLLSVMPQLDGRTQGTDVAVFRPAPVKRLSTGNLVDSMIGLQLQLQLKKVAWKQAVLSVDLAIDGKGNNTRAWMEDMERLLYLAFVQTDNVSRVLVRFVQQDVSVEGTGAGPRVVAATDIRRTDKWLAFELSKLGEANPFSNAVWRQRLRFSFSGQDGNPHAASPGEIGPSS
ncbi:hypothetical protein KZ483_18790 [Paenibacillus sp. sptzw28]|uniref:hypothetical protein n=1 Tax=Paenibacillus sp. sptzw28 TaxID=715179 RepID=UPI001C6E92BE|nr:hypothetical protein [Paenibacillus sp. sptzw28]QYR19911.1 hypothetical protein KZ483_18790 [Paenibacillus sp. sptzw28]